MLWCMCCVCMYVARYVRRAKVKDRPCVKRFSIRETLCGRDSLRETVFLRVSLSRLVLCKNLLCSVQCVKTSLPSSRSTRKRASVSLLPIMRPCCSVHPGVLRPVRETRCPIIIHQLIILVNLEIWNRKITVAVCEVDYGPCRQCWYQPSLCHTPALLPPSSSRCPSVSK